MGQFVPKLPVPGCSGKGIQGVPNCSATRLSGTIRKKSRNSPTRICLHTGGESGRFVPNHAAAGESTQSHGSMAGRAVYFVQAKFADSLDGLLPRHVPIVRRPGNLQRLADVVDAERLVCVQILSQPELRLGRQQSWTTAFPATSTGSSQSRPRPLLDQPAFELANAEKMWKISSPDALVVSIIPSLMERNPTPRSRRSSISSVQPEIRSSGECPMAGIEHSSKDALNRQSLPPIVPSVYDSHW